MKNKKIKDERIVQITNKILSETYFIIVFFLIISVAIKAYVIGQPFTHYITELGVIFLSTIYIVVRSMMTGNTLLDTSKRSKILTILAVFGLSLTVTVISGVKNYLHYGELYTGIFDLHFIAVLVVSFISSFMLISVAVFFIYLCHKKGQQKIDKELTENEDIEIDGKE